MGIEQMIGAWRQCCSRLAQSGCTSIPPHAKVESLRTIGNSRDLAKIVVSEAILRDNQIHTWTIGQRPSTGGIDRVASQSVVGIVYSSELGNIIIFERWIDEVVGGFVHIGVGIGNDFGFGCFPIDSHFLHCHLLSTA